MSKHIMIDAGHGGKDSGAVGNGCKEKDIALDVSKLLQNELTKRGYRASMTRDGDYFVSLKDRTDKANEQRVDLLISLHLNSYDNPNANGYETFYHKNSSSGKKLASLIQKNIAPLYKSNRGIKTKNLHITRESAMTAVLLELGFISNYADLQSTLKNKQLISKLIADAIDEYYGKTKPNEPQPPKPDKENKIMYRVRKNWNDAKSQIGAYNDLNNAKQLADKNAGYFVFDEKGSVVYPKKHWADVHFDYLNKNGIEVKQKRFNDPLKRGEAMALLHRLHESLSGKVAIPDKPVVDIPEEKPTPPVVEEKPMEKPKPKPQPKSPFNDEIVEKIDGDKTLVYIPFDKILEIRMAINGAGGNMLSLPQMQSRYGFDYVINGGFFSYSKSINTIFDGRHFETSGDFSKFTMLIKRNRVEWGEFYRGNNTGAIGGSPSLIIDGKINIDHSIGHENEKHPRSAIGSTDNGIVLLTVDGRQKGKAGAKLTDVADYMWNLGITNAINLDGGGSTGLMKDEEFINSPLEERKVHNAIGIWISEE